MKNFAAIILLIILASCAFAVPPSGPGFFYTETSDLVYYDPYIKPEQKVALCSKNILGLVSVGDADMNALRMNSTIRKIATIERTYSGRFWVFAESCLIVKGE